MFRLNKSLQALLLVITASTAASAQNYPSCSPTIVVPFAAGGPVDINGREIAEALSQKLGLSFVVENRAGAGGVTGMKYVMSARPDGCTLLVGSPGPLVIVPASGADSLGVLTQLMPIGIISESPQVFAVSAKLPARSVDDLVTLAKAKPGVMNYGSAGIGTTPHLSAELFKKLAGIDIVHVPYRGTAAAIQDVLRGEINVIFGDTATLKPFIESGSLTALAVTGKQRSKLLPDVPAVNEVGFPDLTVSNYSALLVPIKTPQPIVDILVAALADIKNDPVFVARLAANGMATTPSSPEKALEFLESERRQWEPLVKSIGLKP